jgi:small subunit ribosomal protein S18
MQQHNQQQDRDKEKFVNIIPNAVLFNRKASGPKGGNCPLSGKNPPVMDYKNIALLSQYISEKGRIVPSRITGVCAKKQRELTSAIKIARSIALLPFSAS